MGSWMNKKWEAGWDGATLKLHLRTVFGLMHSIIFYNRSKTQSIDVIGFEERPPRSCIDVV